MNKHINIELVDPCLPSEDDYIFDLDQYVSRPTLCECDICNIINKIGDHRITDDEMKDAIDLLAVYFYQQKIYKMIIDIDQRNCSLEPAKEMTLEEIEKKLGHKVKIVAEKEK